MSYRDVHPNDIIGVRKVRWDMLWHVLYKFGKETYDRVSKEEAMEVLEILKQID